MVQRNMSFDEIKGFSSRPEHYCNSIVSVTVWLKPGLHESRKDRKHMFENTIFFQLYKAKKLDWSLYRCNNHKYWSSKSNILYSICLEALTRTCSAMSLTMCRKRLRLLLFKTPLAHFRSVELTQASSLASVYSLNNVKLTVCEHVCKTCHAWLSLHVTVMIARNDISQDWLAVDTLSAIKSSMDYSRK